MPRNRAERGVETSNPPGVHHLDALTAKIHLSGKSVKQAAREIGVRPSHVFNFIARRFHKVGRQKRRLIRNFFRAQGWIPMPKPRPKHECRDCGKLHVIRKLKVNPS